jgi:hypothetical protein
MVGVAFTVMCGLYSKLTGRLEIRIEVVTCVVEVLCFDLFLFKDVFE